MYKAYWGMRFNPFTKETKVTDAYKSTDQKEASKRMEHLKNVRGIGLFTGNPGTGKTFSDRVFVESLNPNLYRTIYLPLTTIPSGDFYRAMARGLGLEAAYRKVDNFKHIQDRIKDMNRDQRVTPVIIIDEAQFLNKAVLNDLKILMNFEMDSQSYAIMILSGHPELNETLSMKIHESLEQRIVVSYNFTGLSMEEVADYVKSRLEISGAATEIFGAGALEAAAGSCAGSIRKLNNLIHKALMIGCDQKAKSIDREIIMHASEEINLV